MKASALILPLCAALVALSALSALAGCSSPCESVCSSFNDCDIKQRANDVDCATYCGREQQFEEAAEEAGADTCQAEFDAHLSCWESNIDNICDAEDKKCEASATAWVDCVAKFCAVEGNEDDQACVPQDEGPALPALAGF